MTLHEVLKNAILYAILDTKDVKVFCNCPKQATPSCN